MSLIRRGFKSSAGRFSNPRDVDFRETNITSPVSASSISTDEEILDLTIENQSSAITMDVANGLISLERRIVWMNLKNIPGLI